MIEIWLM